MRNNKWKYELGLYLVLIIVLVPACILLFNAQRADIVESGVSPRQIRLVISRTWVCVPMRNGKCLCERPQKNAPAFVTDCKSLDERFTVMGK